MRQSFSRFATCIHRDNRGGIGILVAFALPVIIIAVGMAIDYSRAVNAKSRFRNSLDQATLATASRFPDDPQQYASDFFQSNLKNAGVNITVDNFTITHNADKTRWTGEASGKINTILAQVFGINSLAIHHKAVVEWDDTYTSEIVAMVDVSGTMCANFKRTVNVDGSAAIDFVPDSECTKLRMMQLALRKITELGVGWSMTPMEPSYKVGIVPYSFKVKVPSPENVPAFLTAAEAAYDPAYYTNFADAEQNGARLPGVVPLQPVRSAEDKEALLAKIDDITSASNGDSFNRPFMKRSALGAQISGLMLDPAYHDMFGGEMPGEFGSSKSKKTVIMMTDSANLGCCFTNWPQGNFRGNYIYSYNEDHKKLVGGGGTEGLCTQMKDAGMEIFTVLLDVDRRDMDARGEEVVEAFRQCASSDKHAFEVPLGDQQKLEEAYTTIGLAIAKLRLVE